jgi:hypothetical protein
MTVITKNSQTHVQIIKILPAALKSGTPYRLLIQYLYLPSGRPSGTPFRLDLPAAHHTGTPFRLLISNPRIQRTISNHFCDNCLINVYSVPIRPRIPPRYLLSNFYVHAAVPIIIIHVTINNIRNPTKLTKYNISCIKSNIISATHEIIIFQILLDINWRISQNKYMAVWIKSLS